MNVDAAVFNLLRSVSATRLGHKLLDVALSPFNPFSSQRYFDPYSLYDEVRRLDPVYWHWRARMWIVTGYAETIEILRGPVSVDRSSMVSDLSPYREMEPAHANLMLSNMLMQDPPDHTRLRRMVNRGFTPRSVRVMEEHIEASAGAVIAELVEASLNQPVIDIVSAMRDLPVRMICDLLGVPEADRRAMINIADTLSEFADPITGFDPTEMDRAVENLSVLVSELVAERLEHHTDDLISTLLTPDPEGNMLDPEEIVSMVALLLVAGQETTSGLIGNSIVALSSFVDQRAALKNAKGDERIIEELLRYDSPIQATDRTMLEDFELESGPILREGQIVVLCLGGANRDPRQYEAPDQLRLDRDDPRPLSFGHGPHHCLGAALAKMQATAVLSAFVKEFPDYSVDDSEVVWKKSTTLRGPSKVPVLLRG